MLKKLLICLLLITTALSVGAKAAAHSNDEIQANQLVKACLTPKWPREKLLALKKQKFHIASTEEREQLARHLLNCLASPDAELRDSIAFEGLSTWLRTEQLSHAIRKDMFNGLLNAVSKKVNDNYGVYQPFAVLVLAELARVDRLEPYLTAEERGLLVNVALNYLNELRDYRGFEDNIGWRHGVAHSADLLLQLSLNKQINKVQLDNMLIAIANQVSPLEHFYVYGEPKRLAMPVAYIFLRGEHQLTDWQEWLTTITDPTPFASWQDMYSNQAGLVKLHNTRAFLNNFYIAINASKNDTLVKMKPALAQAIGKVN